MRLSSDLALAAVLVAFPVALLLLMRETSRTADNDPLDSSFFWYSWLILPGCAFLASYARPDGARPFLWTAALIGSFVIELALLGTVWHDPDEGASFWLVGEMFVLILGAVTFAAASAGASIALRRRAR